MKSNPMDNPDNLRWAALIVGVIALIIGSRMSFKFGEAMSLEHGYGLMLLAIAGCIIIPAAKLFDSKALRNIGILFLCVEFFSHIGYSVGTRVMNVEQTGIQNAAYEVKQDSAKRNAEMLAVYRGDLDKLRNANPWAVSVSADGLRAQVAPKDEAIRQEERRGGCGPKCLALKTEKAAIEDKIAVVEKDNQISKQIALLELEVNKREDMATTAEFKSSPVVAQTKFVSQIWTWSLDPDQGSITGTQIFIGVLLAFATTFLAPSLFSVAFGAVKLPSFTAKQPVVNAPYSTVDGQVEALKAAFEKMERRAAAPVSAPSQPIHITEQHYQVTDNEEANRIRQAALLAAREFRSAA